MRLRALACASALCVASALASLPARADVRREGEWPDDASELVSLTVDGTRSEAIHALAKAAGWSVVGSALKDERVNVHVTDQPAGKVLALLLGEGDYVVKRDGKLLSIAAAPASKAREERKDPEDTPGTVTPPNWPTPPPTLPVPAAGKHKRGHGEDRTVMGGRAVIARDETVGDLFVFGGSVTVIGNVQGDVSVFGGSLTVQEGGHIHGDVNLLGGTVDLQDGACVDGDVSTAGGNVTRAAGAVVGGDVSDVGPAGRRPHHDKADKNDDEDEHEAAEGFSITHAASSVGAALARTALLFAFGCVLLSLAGGRMELMQHELAERPMRAFALGVVSLLGGVFALVALCVTIIGIPLAIVAVLVGVLGVYAGMCAAFTALGAALLQARTPSPYVHLGLGCALYLLTSSLPFIGWLTTTAAVLIGLGLLVETRGAGIFTRHELPPAAA